MRGRFCPATEDDTKMKKYLLAACAASALGGSAHANMVDARDPWILVGLGWVNGVGLFARDDVAADASIRGEEAGSMPMFATRDQCLAAELRVLAKYKGVDHASGGFGYHLCTPESAWAKSQF